MIPWSEFLSAMVLFWVGRFKSRRFLRGNGGFFIGALAIRTVHEINSRIWGPSVP